MKTGAQGYLTKGKLDQPHPVIGPELRGEQGGGSHNWAKETACESEARYRALAETASDAIITIDEEGAILFVNSAAQNIFGYDREEMLGQKLTMLMPDYLRRVHESAMSRYRITAQRNMMWQAVELPGLHKDGREIPLEISLGEFISNDKHFFTGIIRDITERKRVEEALRASEERYRDLVENANDILYTHDLAGNFISMNKAGELVSGYTRDEALKMNIAQFVAPAHRELVRQMIDREVAGEARTVYELEIIAKDGRRVALEVSSRLIYQNGKPVWVQGIARDVTERKQLEEQLRQSQKMEAVGRLAGGVAHDFSNMLTAISGYSDYLLARLGPSDPMRAEIGEIRKAGEWATALTRQLLAFSRKQILTPQVLDLNAVLANMEKMLQRLIGEDINLSIILDPVLERVKVDSGQIEQVIMNLVVNARDAMPQGGKLTLETTNVELDEAYARRHMAVTPGHYVMLAVSDNGYGMEADTQAHIFEPFFTTKQPSKGTGLGLSTVYGIVKQSGGHIWVYSEPKQGTTFKIYLPPAKEAVETFDRVRPLTELARGSETVLLAEDEEIVRQLVREILQSNGYTVLEARHGGEALLIGEHYAGSIHLMLTDVVMPQMSGWELAQRLAPRRPEMKVLYVSGYTEDAIVHHGVLDRGTRFLQKPFTRDSLARKVREVLDEKIRAFD